MIIVIVVQIGYGPTSLNNYYYYHSLSNNNGRGDDEEFGALRRPFSQHIIYLPSYDSRRLYPSSSYYGSNSNINSRRAKSVDNLDSVNHVFKPSNKHHSRNKQEERQRHNSSGSNKNTD